MSDQSLASLLAWLREESRMLGWGMIIALERDKANLVLRHEYIERFSGDDYLRPISGDVDVADNYWRGVLHNFIFDAPRLQFQTVDAPTPQEPTNTRVQASLAMSLMSGGLVSMENDNIVWRIRRVQAFDTLLDAKLYLHLEMPQTLVIGADGAIKLDFRFSDDFEVDLGEDSDYNQQVAIALKSLFHELEDGRRMYSLLVIPESVDAIFRPQAVTLYPQVNPNAPLDPRAGAYGSGALLALAKTRWDHGAGTLPGPNYRYLIPDDKDKNYSGTVMLKHGMTVNAVEVGPRILGWLMQSNAWSGLVSDYFSVSSDPVAGTWRAAFLKGRLEMPESHVPYGPFHSRSMGKYTYLDIYHRRVHFLLDGSSTVLKYGFDNYELRLMRTTSSQTGIEFNIREGGNFYVDSDAYLALVLHYRVVCKNDDLCLGVQDVTRGSHCLIPTVPWHWYAETDLDYDFEQRWNYATERLANINSSYSARVDVALRPFWLDHSFHPAVDAIIAASFGGTFQAKDIRSPLDTACFGILNPGKASFEITPHELIIAPDATHQFTTNAPQGPLHWTASNIDPSSTSVAGSIGTDGTYRAPPLNSIRGNHTRVRVSATQDGNTASALVTVVAQPLAINPLIATCEADRSGGTGDSKDHIVELSAGLIQKEGATITWTIKNMIEGESGSVHPGADGHTCTFTAHPYLSTKKCVLDEVEVSVQTIENGQSVTRTRQALVLASHAGFGLNLFIEEATPHMLRLIAKRNDVEGTVVEPEWSVAAQSPGVIGEEDGIYVPDSASTQPFALIFAKVEGRLKSEGYLIVPLPYLDFPEELILLSQPHELVETNVAPSH